MSDLDIIAQRVLAGDQGEVQSLVLEALAQGADARDILAEGLMAGITLVGAQFAQGKAFIPEMLLAARAMQDGIDLLAPHLAGQADQSRGTMVIGTVQGDVHDIGKNLVGLMLKGVGLKIIDLGTNVHPHAFVQAVRDNNAQIVALSALLTTTMLEMAEVIKALEAAGLRDQVRVMVGGAPVTQVFADAIGADGYASDAAAASQVALALLRAPRGPREQPAAAVQLSTGDEPSREIPLAQPTGCPELPLSYRERIARALQHREGPVPWVEIGVDEVVMAKILGRVPFDWLPTSHEEAKLDLGWAEKVAFARQVGLGALGIDHRLFLGSYRTGHFPVVNRCPLIKSRADLSLLQAPKLTARDVYPEIERALQAIDDTGIALYVELSFCFDQVVADLGFDKFCYMLRDDPGFIVQLFQRYEEINGHLIDLYSSIPEIDFIWISDDVAYKGGPLLAPEMLRKYVFPVFRRLAARMQKPWIFHSDGALSLVLDDIIDLGCHAIHPCEAGCNDIYGLKKQIGERIALHGNLPVDLIARGSQQEVRDEARRLLTHLSPGGGYIFSSGNSISYFARAENVLCMAETLRRFNAEAWR